MHLRIFQRPQTAHTLTACATFLYLKNVLVLTNILRPNYLSLLTLIGREDYENKNTDRQKFREDNDGDE